MLYTGGLLLDLAIVAVLLLLGNIQFYRFDPRQPWWRRLGKVAVTLALAAISFYYFGHAGVAVLLAIFLIPFIYVHGIWLPRHGVNGWTCEPRDKYYAIRGWPPEGQ